MVGVSVRDKTIYGKENHQDCNQEQIQVEENLENPS